MNASDTATPARQPRVSDEQLARYIDRRKMKVGELTDPETRALLDLGDARATIADLRQQIEARTAEWDDAIERAAKIAETCADAPTSSRGCRASSYDGRCGERIAAAIRVLATMKEEG